MAAANLAVLHEIFADWEQGNFRRTDYLHPEFELVYARDFLDAGEFHGLEAVSHGWRGWLSQWSSWRVIPVEWFELGDRTAVRIRVEGVAKASGMTLTEDSATLFDFRDGLPSRVTLYGRFATMAEDLGLAS